jgi:hypothetical protein
MMKMLNMGFYEDIKHPINYAKEKYGYSTMPAEVARIENNS